MPLSNKRKLSFAVLGLMVAALGVDRFILGNGAGGPQSAAASTPDQLVPSPSVPLASVPKAARPERSIALRLADLRESLPDTDNRGVDLFHATPEWLIPPPAPEAPVVKETAPVVDLLKDFASKHRLTSVMLGGNTSMVVIDGIYVKQGEVFAGLRLTKVERGAATFEEGGKFVRLTVDSTTDQPTPPGIK